MEKWIRIKPGKTDKSKVRKQPVVVEIPLLPELEDELSFAPSGNLTFLVTEYGRPFSENGLGNKMRQWCDEAGLPNCSAHGVRKAGATVAAENGATHEQLKAIYGWTTYQQPDHYIRKARRRKVASSARTLLVFDRNENEIVPLSEGIESGGTKRPKNPSKSTAKNADGGPGGRSQTADFIVLFVGQYRRIFPYRSVWFRDSQTDEFSDPYASFAPIPVVPVNSQ